MSIKVYEGYRFKAKYIHEFIEVVRETTIQIMANLLVDIPATRDEYRAALKIDNVDIGMLKEMSFESGWVFFFHKGYIYTYPYGFLSGTVEVQQPLIHKVQSLEYVQSFHYWNNVDPDETVDEVKWEVRGAIWDEVLDLRPFHVTTFHLWEVSAVETEYLQSIRARCLKWILSAG